MLDLNLFKIKYSELYENKYNEILKNRTSKNALKEALNGAQCFSIKETFKWGIINFVPEYPVEVVWEIIHETYLHYRLKEINFETLTNADKMDIIKLSVSAEQSWKSSSGNTFETCIKEFMNPYLVENNIQFILQKDLNELIKKNNIHNCSEDINYLKERIKTCTFDLFAVVQVENRNYVFGCLQAKTSIRDRITRDREPSKTAMDNHFWSVIIALNGEFLKTPKYRAAVNGNSTEYTDNGWHAMYTMSDKYLGDRIKHIDKTFLQIVEDAKIAADVFLNNRELLDLSFKI